MVCIEEKRDRWYSLGEPHVKGRITSLEHNVAQVDRNCIGRLQGAKTVASIVPSSFTDR